MASSSPLSSLPQSQPENSSSSTSQPIQYRPATQLPFELAQHVRTYFEETLFTQAFGFLTSLVASGAGSATLATPAITPSPAHLALSATLAVHPTLTTRTTSKEKWDQANAALRILRLINKIVGPVNASFSSAFEFKHYDTRSRKSGQQKDDTDLDAEMSIESPYTNIESIWTRAEDFWHIVGWAFNCSCLDGMYAARWSHWVLWLEFVVQVLEDDWKIHFHQQTCEESLMMTFIDNTAGGHIHERRIMRAIFADGTTKPMNEFREIFKNELKEPKNEVDKVKKREVEKVNVEEEEYGDYLESDNSDGDYSQPNTIIQGKRSRTPSTRRITPRNSGNSLRSESEAETGDTAVSTPNGFLLGGRRSLRLRLRLLHLLSHISGAIPESFIELNDLYTFFVEFTKPLPLPTFAAIVTSRVFSPDAQATLCEFLLQRLLETSAPGVTGMEDEPHITRTKLVRDYLPYASSRRDVLSNARVSLCLEQLIRGYVARGMMGSNLQEQEGEKVRKAVRKGVERREKAAKKKNGGDEEAWVSLMESGRRMQRLVRDLK